MGHTVDSTPVYERLQQRLDRNVTGAPDSPTLIEILRILFSVEDAELAARIPTRPTSIEQLALRIGMAADALEDKITDLARRGLVVDLYHDDERFVSLAPVVIGFFEFTFMRTRDDLPMKRLAELFEQYFYESDRFGHAGLSGSDPDRPLARSRGGLARDGPRRDPGLGAGEPHRRLGLGPRRLAVRLPAQGVAPGPCLRPAAARPA